MRYWQLHARRSLSRQWLPCASCSCRSCELNCSCEFEMATEHVGCGKSFFNITPPPVLMQFSHAPPRTRLLQSSQAVHGSLGQVVPRAAPEGKERNTPPQIESSQIQVQKGGCFRNNTFLNSCVFCAFLCLCCEQALFVGCGAYAEVGSMMPL